MKTTPGRPTAWTAAAGLLARWLGHRERIDRLMEQLPSSLGGAERARCQHLVYGVVRHAGRIEAALDRVVAHPPRFGTRAILFLAGFELIEDGADLGRAARIVHHAVEQAKARASAAEGRLVNAVARKLAETLPAQVMPPVGAPAAALTEYYSHPLWLVHRWLAQHGPAATHALLEWNQRPAPVYARVRGDLKHINNYISGGKELAPLLTPTPWPPFYEVAPGRWAELEPLLRQGRLYVQDPSAQLPVGLLAPQPGEWILDACAAPGGKSLLIADALASNTTKGVVKATGGDIFPLSGSPDPLAQEGVVALDLPGERIERLRENLAQANVAVAVVPADLRSDPALMLKGQGLPAAYPAVLLDAPCTNTGVMRHRVDVKWRLQSGDFQRHAQQQRVLLEAAARLVAPGGRLVYSTCSIDPEENEDVVAAFLERAEGAFTLESQVLSKPWKAGHDGGGAFLLRRRP
jgi:16S rRNA (cytosine967-C5)-methyltransferase